MKNRAMRRLVLTVVGCLALVSLGTAGCADALDTAGELERAGDWQGALTVYQEFLAEEPGDVAALTGASVALTAMQRYDEALVYQELVVAADPEDSQTRIELGFNYLNHQDRTLDAVQVMAEAVTLEPSAKNLAFLSQAQKAAGHEEEAETSLRQAIEVDPEYGYAYSLLVTLLTEEGRDDEAARVVEEARLMGLELNVVR